jgi:uncharacterized membrane protein YjgN (DUF898 family)
MAFCKNCGSQLLPGESFCKNCGASAVTGSTWDGGVFETIVTSIAAALICAITCGIGAPWAICFTMRFVIGHTVIDGRRLCFDGTGGQLFGNWIKWFLLIVVTCGIYSFWVIPRLYKWTASHIHTAN